MSNRKASENFSSDLYQAVITLCASAVCVLSILTFKTASVNTEFFIISIVGVFLSPYLQIQLPRTKIHLTVSEILVFFILLTYGSGAAVIVGALEMLYMSIISYRKKEIKTRQTILFNVAIVVVSTFLTASALNLGFVPDEVIADKSIAGFGVMLMFMAVVQFFGNSIGVSFRQALKSEKPFRVFWEVWFKYCVNVLVMFIAAAMITGLLVKSHTEFNSQLFLLTGGVAVVIYITYRRYIDDIKITSAKAEQAERMRAEQAEQAERARAEQAERHIEELQHHIAEQDRTSQALRESKERFRHAAFHDSLTDLPNRNFFIETLKSCLEKSRIDKNFKFAVLFLDINRFKTINDSLGHSTGDRLILHVAKRLATAVRENDLVARFSGDEFAFILNDIEHLDNARYFAERIEEKISEPFSLSGRQIFISFSIGIAIGNDEYEAAQDILRDADIAMYHAKDSEKAFVVFDKNMHTRAVSLLQLETDLRMAIERGELIMYYQPIINLDTMRLAGFESLIRWNHPTRGLVPPNEFIPVSEATGFIIPLTLWILETSCRQTVEWQNKNAANKNLIVSVNLSGKHFAQKNLVGQIREIIQKTGINPACVKLELTESAVMENVESVILMMKQIRELGIQLSIDDFGTGYSSLSYLHRFPINTLKVDRSFVSAIKNTSENGEIVRTVVTLAKTLGLNVVAEGIETIHQLQQLRVLGCEYGQGYLFSRPIAAEEAEKLLEDKSRFEDALINNPIQNVEINLQLPNFTAH